MLGSGLAGNSNLTLQIDNPNTPTARGVIQFIQSQGNAFGDLYLNPGGGTATGGVVYVGRRLIIGSDQPGQKAADIRFGGTDTEIQAISVAGTSYGNIFLNPTAGDVSVAPHGTAKVRVLTITGGSDLAEPFAVNGLLDSTARIEPGMIVTIDPNRAGELMLATQAYDRKVAGVISGANGLAPGMIMKAEGTPMADGEHNVALTGRVWCWCDAGQPLGGGGDPIEPGDRLTTSATPGHAMKVTDESRAPGSVIGKAMTPLHEGRGLVLVLVNLQ